MTLCLSAGALIDAWSLWPLDCDQALDGWPSKSIIWERYVVYSTLRIPDPEPMGLVFCSKVCLDGLKVQL